MQENKVIFSRNVKFWKDEERPVYKNDVAQLRVSILTYVFILVYIFIAFRLIMFVCFQSRDFLKYSKFCSFPHPRRADIVDCNGVLLATDIITYSVFADPQVVPDAAESLKMLQLILPSMPYAKLSKQLQRHKRFVWIARHISPQTKSRIEDLGIPGICFRKEYVRLYPHGNVASHVLGYCNIDRKPLCGVEKYFDESLKADKPLKLALDIRLQSIAHDVLSQSVAKFRARAGNVLLMDDCGQIKCCVSLPDFDPNKKSENKISAAFNRNFQGVYEFGSCVKILTATIALESKTASLASQYDARETMYIGKFPIKEDNVKNMRVLSFKEAFIMSSNIACIKMATKYGHKMHQHYFKKLDLLSRMPLEIGESGRPLIPSKWDETRTKSIAYGYSIAFSPISLLTAVATVINNGCKIKPTLLCNHQKQTGCQVISHEVSGRIRELMGAVVAEGTGRKAHVDDLVVMGKSGTAFQFRGKHYDKNSRSTTFISSFNINDRQYFMILMLEAPQPTPETYGFATAGWTAAPTSGECIRLFSKILNIF